VLDAAASLGAARGVSALSIQAIANAAGVSKALVLYHHADKPTLLRALHAHIGAANARRMTAAAAAVDPADPLEAWRALAREETARGELPLLAALAHDAANHDRVAAVAREREAAAARLAAAVFRALGVTARVETALIGRALLRHLDGLVLAWAAPGRRGGTAGGGRDVRLDAELDAELDAFALALLGLGE
jgi:AcrR family transcriptional regulator